MYKELIMNDPDRLQNIIDDLDILISDLRRDMTPTKKTRARYLLGNVIQELYDFKSQLQKCDSKTNGRSHHLF